MPDNPQLAAFIDQLSGAVASGNMQNVQEAIREYNLSYANNVAQLYGQNWGPGQPAPIGASTLAAGQQFGSIGYIPGYTGPDVGQTLSQIQGAASMAQAGAGLTGWYAAPSQSEFSPGTFVRLDPSTYDTNQYGDTQISYVLPSGQLQRVSTTQARAMGWNGDTSSMPTTSAQHALELERAPPSQLPAQTLQGLTTYSNLNTQAQNQALAQAGVTGMYNAPAAIQPPGTNWGGAKFSDLPPDVQRAYYLSRGSDWNAAMNAWVQDSNAAIQAAGGGPPGAGTPQETLAAQQQYFTQANALASQFGQYYAPLAPGQTGQAGVTGPQQGQLTQSMQEQLYRQQLDAINAAAALQANPFRQAQVIGQLGGLLGGQGVAGFQAPSTTNQTDFSGMGNMQQMLNDIRAGGVQTGGQPGAPQFQPQQWAQTGGQQVNPTGMWNGPKSGAAWDQYQQQQAAQQAQAGQMMPQSSGGLGMGYFGSQQPAQMFGGPPYQTQQYNYGGQVVTPNWGTPNVANLQQTIDDIRGGAGATNSYDPQNVLNAIPTPNKLDSVNFYRSSPGTQNMILQGMQEKYGLAPQESLAQIKNTMPTFNAPTTFGQIKG